MPFSIVCLIFSGTRAKINRLYNNRYKIYGGRIGSLSTVCRLNTVEWSACLLMGGCEECGFIYGARAGWVRG